MIVPLRQHERRAPALHRLDDVLANVTIALLIADQLLVQGQEFNALVRGGFPDWLKCSRLHDDEVRERPACRLHFRVHAMANRSALHEDDRMVAILAGNGRRQSQDIPCLGLTHHLLEARRREVMTLVDDHVTVLGDAIIDDAF